jgi:pimeloyl-ACP methyl ester carboxylesterase
VSSSARRRPAYRLAASVSATLLLGTGCGVFSGEERASDPATGAPTSASPSPSPTRSAPEEPGDAAAQPAPPSGLERFYDQRVTWRSCSDGFECATVKVPLDYREPDGRSIGIAVSRRPATDPGRRRGAILVNPGGPGASGIAFAPTALAQFRADVLARYDVVGFDPRGVAASQGVDCLSDAELDEFIALDPTPDNAAATTRALRQITEFGRGCVRGAGALAGHVSTPEAARDMDVVRAVVRSPELNYYGASYGTLLGATYADLFPKRVGAMVLDGAVDPTQSLLQENLKAAAGFQTALDAYLRYCVRQGDCPLGDSVPVAQRRLNALLDRIDDRPLPGDGQRRLTIGHAVLGVWLPLYVPELYPTLTVALQSALRGQGGPLLRLSDFYVSRGPGGYQDNSMEALYAVNCLDESTSMSPAQVRRLIPRFEQRSSTFGEVFAWFLVGCPQWPVQSAEPLPEIDAPGAPPILVIGTTGDPATPYESAVALAGQLRSGVLVTRVGEGHTGFGRGNACVDATVNDFFARGAVPRDGKRCG